MQKNRPWFVLSAFAAALAFALPAGAETTCPQIPKVAFWGELTHDAVRSHVNDQLAGDWDIYIDQLETQQNTLRGIQKRGSGAVIMRKGEKIKLAGKSLDKYLDYGAKRLRVVRCLADAELDSLTGFATAAGTPDPPAEEPKRAKDMQRTFISMPKDMMKQLRDRAVRQSARDARKVSVNDVVVEILERELRRSRR